MRNGVSKMLAKCLFQYGDIRINQSGRTAVYHGHRAGVRWGCAGRNESVPCVSTLYDLRYMRGSTPSTVFEMIEPYMRS